MNTTWTVQDAKNRFSEVIEHALTDGPQTITRRGKETAVLVSVDAFLGMSCEGGSLVEFLRESPLSGMKLDLERKPDYGRDVEL